ncbi:MAG: cytochrome c oxidase subunit II [Ktedonobacteraceae bacterium]
MRKSLFRKARPWLILLTGVLFAFFLAACGEESPAQYGAHTTLTTAGPVADSERFLFYVVLGIATFIFVVVEGALVYSIFRFRSKPGAPNPYQNHGNLRIEALWTIIPALVLFVVLGFTIQGLFQVSTVPPGKSITVEAVGHQWWWEFYYPDYNITTADSLHAPVGTVVNVKLYSNNVIHSFWIPALTGKTDDIPGHNNTKWFRADQTGVYYGECAEFCGAQHAHMAFNAVIDSQDNFNTWVTTQQQAAVVPAQGSLEAQGAKIFNGVCTACHGIVGHGVAGSDDKYIKGYEDPSVACNDPNKACLVGPNLTHFAQRNLIAGGVLVHNRDQCLDPNHLENCNLAKWLANPQGIKPGNDMVVNVTKDQIKALVAYLESLN